MGVDTKAPLSDFYAPEVSTPSRPAPRHRRWAIPQGQGDLLGALQGEQPVANAVNEVANGSSAEEAVKQADGRDRGGSGVVSDRPSGPAPPRDAGAGAARRQVRPKRGRSAPGPAGPADRLPAHHAHS